MRGMITRRRIRNFCIGLCFYAASGAAVGYFAFHAHHGERGLRAKAEFKVRIAHGRGTTASPEIGLARLPCGWNHPNEKNSRQINALSMFSAKKWFPLFRNRL